MPTVPVGLTTKAGYSVALTALVTAVIAYVTGDHSAENTAALAAAIIGGVSYAITQIGRYAQATALAKSRELLPADLYAALVAELDDPAGESDPAAPKRAATVETHSGLSDE